MPEKPTYTVGIEMAVGSFTDVTSDVMRFTVSRELTTLFTRLREGSALIELENNSGRYSPRNSGGPYYGLLLPYRRVSITADWGRNLLRWSEAVEESPWSVSANQAVVSANAAVAPNGFTAADTLTDIASLGQHFVEQPVTVTTISSGSGYGFSVHGKVCSGTGYFWMRPGSEQLALFNLSSGTYVGPINSGGNAPSSATIAITSANFYRCAAIWTKSNSSNLVQFGVTHNASTTVYSGNGQAVYVWGSQLEVTTVSSYYKTEQYAYRRPLFYGRIREVSVQPALGERIAIVDAVDEAGLITDRTITTSLFENYNPTSLFTAIFSSTLVGSFVVQSMSQDTVGFAWWDNEKPATAIEDLVRFGNYAVYVEGSGTFRAMNRDFDQVAANASYRHRDFYAFDYRLDSDRLMNDILVKSRPRKFDTSVQTVAWIEGAVTLTGSSWVSFYLQYLDPSNREPVPAKEFATIAASGDYYMSANSDGTGSDYTATASVAVQYFGATAVCTIFNGQANVAYLTRFQLRGKPARRIAEVTIGNVQNSSQAVYGKRTYTVENDLITYQHAVSYGQFLVANYVDPQHLAGFELANQFPDILDLDLTRVVTVAESNTGTDDAYTVVAVDHDVSLSVGLRHQARFGFQPQRDFGYLYLDHPVKGQLDNRRLAF